MFKNQKNQKFQQRMNGKQNHKIPLGRGYGGVDGGVFCFKSHFIIFFIFAYFKSGSGFDAGSGFVRMLYRLPSAKG